MRNPFTTSSSTGGDGGSSAAPSSTGGGGRSNIMNDPASDLLLRPIASSSTDQSDDGRGLRRMSTTGTGGSGGLKSGGGGGGVGSLGMRIAEEEGEGSTGEAGDRDVERTGPAGPTETYRLYKRRFVGLAVLCLLNIVVSWGWLTYAPVVTITTEYFGLESETGVNWLSTVVLWAYVVATPLVLYLLHHHPLRPTLFLSASLLLVGSWLRYAAARTKSFPLLMTGQILLGLSQPFVLSSPPYYSALHFSATGRISATALASLSNPIGAALAQLINPFLATKASDIPSMTLWVSIIATIATLSVVLVPGHPPTPPSKSASELALAGKPSWQESWRALKGNRQFWIIGGMFWIYLGLFNASSTLLAQLLQPAGYSADEAGITGAVLIVVGLVCSAITSPIVDRNHAFVPFVKLVVPLVAASYIALIPVIEAGRDKAGLPGVMVVAAVMGGSSFSLLPVALELVAEVTYPVSAEWGSCGLWVGGQMVGAVLVLGLDAMRGVGEGGDVGRGEGERNEGGRVKGMRWASVVMAVLAAVAVVGVLGLRKVKGRVGVDVGAR